MDFFRVYVLFDSFADEDGSRAWLRCAAWIADHWLPGCEKPCDNWRPVPQDIAGWCLAAAHQRWNEETDRWRILPIFVTACAFSCPPCPTVQAVVLMLNGLIELKNLNL